MSTTKLDGNQVLKAVYDESENRLRVDAEVTAVIGDIEVHIDQSNDSIRIGDGTNLITSTNIVGKQGLDTYIINGPGVDAINIQDGGNSLTVDSVDLDIRNLSSLTDSVSAIQNGTWSVRITDGTNTASITASNAIKVDGSAVIQPISGTVTANAGTGTFTVGQSIASNLNAQVVGNVAASSIDSGNPVKIGGVYNTVLPTLTDGQRGNLQLDSNSKLIIRPLTSVDIVTNQTYEQTSAFNGEMFSVATNSTALTGTSETPYLYFQNPNASNKIIKIYKIDLGPTLGNNYVTYRIYLNPTITSNGTALTVRGNRQTSQNSTVINVFSIPTASSNGTFLKSIVNSGLTGQSITLLYNFNFLIEQNNSLLITRHLSSNATIGGINLEWIEQ